MVDTNFFDGPRRRDAERSHSDQLINQSKRIWIMNLWLAANHWIISFHSFCCPLSKLLDSELGSCYHRRSIKDSNTYKKKGASTDVAERYHLPTGADSWPPLLLPPIWILLSPLPSSRWPRTQHSFIWNFILFNILVKQKLKRKQKKKLAI